MHGMVEGKPCFELILSIPSHHVHPVNALFPIDPECRPQRESGQAGVLQRLDDGVSEVGRGGVEGSPTCETHLASATAWQSDERRCDVVRLVETGEIEHSGWACLTTYARSFIDFVYIGDRPPTACGFDGGSYLIWMPKVSKWCRTRSSNSATTSGHSYFSAM